jgi:hypothetical protein
MAALIHATSVHLPGLGGALLTGQAGSGKSDLALRLIDEGALLVADDQTALSFENGRLIARSPKPTRGIIEIRGIGILAVPAIAASEIRAAFILGGPSAERLPLQQNFALPAGLAAYGLALPAFALAALEASAPSRIRSALSGLRGHFRNDTGPGQ